ncbi:MAG: hypothetical protein NTW49_12855 [Bacteroidia bacterium]|nr:hypothetical protein [Bacteroidia bacterium]
MKFLFKIPRSVFLTGMAILATAGCNSPDKATVENIRVKQEVTAGYVRRGVIDEYLKMNAVTVFQKKENIRSAITGYISTLNYKPGDYVAAGSVYCFMITKEQKALKNLVSLDSSVTGFRKPLPVYCNTGGIVTTQLALQGNYSGEGDVIATISEPSSLVVLLNVPYEYHHLVIPGKKCEILLPDGNKIQTIISKEIPSVDAVSQSQNFIISLPDKKLPENLNVIVQLVKKTSVDAMCIDRSAIQTNETQDAFWIMKFMNDTMAVKVPVNIGLQNDSMCEISSPVVRLNDRVIINGAYGMSDTALVKISLHSH